MCWAVRRSLIGARRRLEVLADIAADARPGLLIAVHDIVERLDGWRHYHAETVDLHDPMFDANAAWMGEWAARAVPDLDEWSIKDDLKDEMYRELATTVRTLRGEAVEPPSRARYWQRPVHTPKCHLLRADGMPPFAAAAAPTPP
jgi:hypothetical protein